MNIRWISSRAAYYEREDEQGGDQDDEEEEEEDQEGGKKRKGTSVEQSQKQSQAGEKGQKGQNTVGDGGNRLYENFTKPFRDSLRSPLQPLMEVI